MRQSVLILGGYGNFGKRIAQALAHAHIPVIIAGRDKVKAESFAASLPLATAACFDVRHELSAWLEKLQPALVINTCGPFQNSDYAVAQNCIRCGVHYIDLADGRDFVAGITGLDGAAKEKGVAVIAGASTVPGLSSAVLDHFRPEFAQIDLLKYGISPGQKAERGLATTKAILSYVGRPLKPFAGRAAPAYGWQDIYLQDYPIIGKRWMANCDIPDLDLLPAMYGIRKIQFSAGLELGFLHLGLWLCSWLVRWGVLLNLPSYAGLLLAISNWFNAAGSADGGMHMIVHGTNRAGKKYQRRWFILARDGHGPHIPTIPAILLAKKITQGQFDRVGAMPCVGLVSLQEYSDALSGYAISTYTDNLTV